MTGEGRGPRGGDAGGGAGRAARRAPDGAWRAAGLRGVGRAALAAGALAALCASSAAQDPWADRVVEYVPGADPTRGYDDPLTALGAPERMTGERGGFPGVVSVFNGAWGVDEVVSLGEGGRLTVWFAEPIVDDPAHRFGVDLIVFGNGFLVDGDSDGRADSIFAEGPCEISVSADGRDFRPVAGRFDDALFPAQGYLDSGPFDDEPGRVPSDFLRPVDPALGLDDLLGRTYEEILALYDGSGGGVPVDIASSGLSAVHYVRIDVPTNPDGQVSPEFDAFAAVPEPTSAALLGLGALLLSGIRRRARERGAPVRGTALRRRAGTPRPTRMTAARALLLVAAAAAGPAAVARADGWSHLAADATRSGVSSVAPPALERVAWRSATAVDEEFVWLSSPVVMSGRVYVVARAYADDVQVENRLIAFDAATGERLWHASIAPDVLDSWSSPAADGPRGLVVVASGDSLWAIDVADGSLRWRTPLAAPVVNASPALTDGLERAGVACDRVLITDHSPFRTGRIYGVNVDPFDARGNPYQPGEIVWRRDLPATSGNTPAFAAGLAVCASAAGTIHAFDAVDGTPIWTTQAARDGFFGGVALRGGYVYAASYNFDGGGNNSELVKLDLSDGGVIWSVPCERTSSIPVVSDDGRVYLSAGINGFGSVVTIQAFQDQGASAVRVWDTYRDSGGALLLGGWAHQPAWAGGLLCAGSPDPAGYFGPYAAAVLLDPGRRPDQQGFLRARRDGAGGTSALAAGRLYSIGGDGLVAFGRAAVRGGAHAGAAEATGADALVR